MLSAVTDRVERMRRAARRATPAPLLLRCTIALVGLLGVVVAYPPEVLASRYLLALLLIVAAPAVLPRGRAATVATLVVVAGWLLNTTWFGQPVLLWRVLAVATALYLVHTLTALAAVLPYDAVVSSEVPSRWMGTALAVLLASAVLTVVALTLTAQLAGPALLAATVLGLAAAVAVVAVLTRLLRRS